MTYANLFSSDWSNAIGDRQYTQTMNYQQAILAQQAYLTSQNRYPYCPHTDCPICKKVQEDALNWAKRIIEEREAKIVAYKNRCDEYMKRFREKQAKRNDI